MANSNRHTGGTVVVFRLGKSNLLDEHKFVSFMRQVSGSGYSGFQSQTALALRIRRVRGG